VHLTVTAEAAESRPWRLTGYTGQDKKTVAHSTVEHGDRALDAAMKLLEADSSITRITVAPA
jgi:hypothetical protein